MRPATGTVEWADGSSSFRHGPRPPIDSRREPTTPPPPTTSMSRSLTAPSRPACRRRSWRTPAPSGGDRGAHAHDHAGREAPHLHQHRGARCSPGCGTEAHRVRRDGRARLPGELHRSRPGARGPTFAGVPLLRTHARPLGPLHRGCPQPAAGPGTGPRSTEQIVLGPGDLGHAARSAGSRHPRRRRHVPVRPSRHRQVERGRARRPAYEDIVLVPHCVEVDGQIVSVFDPTLHDAVADQPAGMDRRWVACHRARGGDRRRAPDGDAGPAARP